MHQNRSLDADPRRLTLLRSYGRDPENLDQVGECVVTTMNASDRNPVVGLKWEVSFNSSVSNSHRSPVVGQTNWRGEPGLPRGYPGFRGRVWVRYKRDPENFSSSSRLESVLIHPGSGGGGSYDGPWKDIYSKSWKERTANKKPKYPCHCYSWDVQIFADDWPGVKHELEQQELVNRLRGVKESYGHTFFWEDPETAKADLEFLSRTC